MPLHHLHQVDVEAAGQQQGAHFTCGQSRASVHQPNKKKVQPTDGEVRTFFFYLPLQKPCWVSGFGFFFYQELVVTGTKPQTLTVAGDECGDGAGSSFKHTGGVGVDQHSCHQLAVDGGPAQNTRFLTRRKLKNFFYVTICLRWLFTSSRESSDVRFQLNESSESCLHSFPLRSRRRLCLVQRNIQEGKKRRFAAMTSKLSMIHFQSVQDRTSHMYEI